MVVAQAIKEDETAPDGKLWVGWVVQLGAYKSRNYAEHFIKMMEDRGIISILKLY